MKKQYLLFITLLLTLTAVAQIPTNGLVAYYPFSGNANDVSGNNLNGTVAGATLTTDHLGNANSAYYFDGVNNFIEIPHNNSFNNQTYTISFWYEFSTATTPGSGGLNVNPALISKVLTTTTTPSAYDNWVFYEATSLVGFASGVGGLSGIGTTPTGQNNGQWHHLSISVEIPFKETT